MTIDKKTDATAQNINISETLTTYESIKSAESKAKQQEVAAKLKELEDLTKLVSTLENAGNGEGDSPENVYQTVDSDSSQTLDFIQKVTTSAQADAKKKEGEDLLSSTDPDLGATDNTGKVPININGQVYIIDVIPFQAFIEQLKQRLEQALLNIDTHKMQIAAYIGDTVNSDGSITKADNGGIMGILVSSIIAGGDAKAQQTIISSVKDLSTGLAQAGGAALTEFVQGSTAPQEEEVAKAKNALDAVDKIPQLDEFAGDGALGIQRRSQALTNGVNDLKDNTGTLKDSTFGSKADPANPKKVIPADVAEINNDPTIVNDQRAEADQVSVKDAIASATDTERSAIKKQLRKQVDKAEEALRTQQHNNSQRRQVIQQIIQNGGQAAGGSIMMQTAQLQIIEANQQAIQTQAQSVNSTANDMMSTAKQTASDTKQSMKDTLDALNAEIRIVNQRV